MGEGPEIGGISVLGTRDRVPGRGEGTWGRRLSDSRFPPASTPYDIRPTPKRHTTGSEGLDLYPVLRTPYPVPRTPRHPYGLATFSYPESRSTGIRPFDRIASSSTFTEAVGCSGPPAIE